MKSIHLEVLVGTATGTLRAEKSNRSSNVRGVREKHTSKDAKRHRDKQTDRQTGRQTGRQTDRDRQTDRHRQTDRQTDRADLIIRITRHTVANPQGPAAPEDSGACTMSPEEPSRDGGF